MNIIEILSKVGFDWQVALANLVNFLVIFFILKTFVFRPVGDIINKRKETIEKGLIDAEDAKSKLANAENESESIIIQAKKDAENIIVESREEGRRVRERIEEDARAKESEIIKIAKEKAELEHVKMLNEVRSEAVDLVLDTTTAILKKEMTEKEHELYIEKATDLLKNKTK